MDTQPQPVPPPLPMATPPPRPGDPQSVDSRLGQRGVPSYIVYNRSPLQRLLIVVVSLAVFGAAVAGVWALTHTSGTPRKQAAKSSAASQQSTGSQAQKNRNAQRRSDILALQTQLEAFFSQNSYYPSLSDLNSPSWRAAYMPGLDPKTLLDPSSLCNPAAADCLTAVPIPHAYAYSVKDRQGNNCEDDDQQCARYTLTATYEGKYEGAASFAQTSLN